MLNLRFNPQCPAITPLAFQCNIIYLTVLSLMTAVFIYPPWLSLLTATDGSVLSSKPAVPIISVLNNGGGAGSKPAVPIISVLNNGGGAGNMPNSRLPLRDRKKNDNTVISYFFVMVLMCFVNGIIRINESVQP